MMLLIVERDLVIIHKVAEIGYHNVLASLGLYVFRLCVAMIATRIFMLLTMVTILLAHYVE